MMLFASLLALCSPAQALDVRWWGVGPIVSTIVIPGQYPVSLPTVAQGEVDKVKGDIELGVRGVVYPSGIGRIFLQGSLGFGTSAWGQQEFALGWDQVLVKDEEFQLLFGAGIGAGHERFKDKGKTDYLNVNYFPVRGQLTALLRDRVRAYQVSVYGLYHIVGGQQYCTSATADCTSGADGDGLIAGALYAGMGAEVSVLFGDFRSRGKEGGGEGGGGKKNK